MLSLFVATPSLRLAPPIMQMKEQTSTSVGAGAFTGRVVPTNQAVQTKLVANRALVDALGSIAPEMSELTRLRFALAFPDQAEAESALRETVAWRQGEGKSIVESAARRWPRRPRAAAGTTNRC